eukprot:6210696-Pleurochrysis_carterae.AAC.2
MAHFLDAGCYRFLFYYPLLRPSPVLTAAKRSRLLCSAAVLPAVHRARHRVDCRFALDSM